MNWIYLSPHFDDAALSCGGLIWEQRRAGFQVSIWTIFAGGVPTGPLSKFAMELHERWQESWLEAEESGRDAGNGIVEVRRDEDILSCEILKADHRHFDIPDCIYRYAEDEFGVRTHLYASRQALFDFINPTDSALVDGLSAELSQFIEEKANIVCPLGLGNHVDHQIVRSAAERSGQELLYYADFPYTREDASNLEGLQEKGWIFETHTISPEGLEAWQNSIAAHRSQISSFWPNLKAMQAEVEEYCKFNHGVRLWKSPGRALRACFMKEL